MLVWLAPEVGEHQGQLVQLSQPCEVADEPTLHRLDPRSFQNRISAVDDTADSSLLPMLHVCPGGSRLDVGLLGLGLLVCTSALFDGPIALPLVRGVQEHVRLDHLVNRTRAEGFDAGLDRLHVGRESESVGEHRMGALSHRCRGEWYT